MTKLKCKKCRLFFKDDGQYVNCPKCGYLLKRIRVHIVNPNNLIVSPKTPMKKEKK